MMYEVITIDRLDYFSRVVDEYNKLLERKEKIKNKLGLKGVDYSKDRVQSGSKKPSEQERYVMALQKVNAEISEFEAWIKPEKDIIKNQIARISRSEYRYLIVRRYIDRLKWSEIVKEFFEFEADYEQEKYDKYRDKVMYWNKRALEELEKISARPYISAESVADVCGTVQTASQSAPAPQGNESFKIAAGVVLTRSGFTVEPSAGVNSGAVNTVRPATAKTEPLTPAKAGSPASQQLVIEGICKSERIKG